MKRFALLLSLSGVLALTAAAQSKPELAATPPMGWNSWDSYGLTVTESQFRANVEWLHEHLQPYGWKYVVIDEGWYLAHPEDSSDPGYTLSAKGLYLPAIDRFPSAGREDGFKPLADYVHSLGLKFSIHIIRGIPRGAVEKNLPIAGSPFHAAEAADRSDRCGWNQDNYGVRDNAAGQAYYDSVMQLYASWGVDFVKVDCISSPYKAASIRMIDKAIAKTGRPMVLSLSPGPTPLVDANQVARSAQMWRISNDFWDLWTAQNDEHGFPQNLKDQFALLAAWEPYAGPGHWPDGDMLPIGYLGPHPGWGEPRQSRLSLTEVRTLITLWSIARSPLILGANLTRMDPATEALLTNIEVLDVDQHTTDNHAIQQTGQATNPHANDIVFWIAREEDDTILAVFNRTDRAVRINLPPWPKLGSQFGLDRSSYLVQDLWLRKNIGRRMSLSVMLPAHGAALYRLSNWPPKR
ncbi:MAG TPA: glycoside hydrolase family 27 protein [Acidobacteriaceae bacterium]|nr:glycoside hydrolase family 27 protein [Acidobacteriaceae bacterium]